MQSPSIVLVEDDGPLRTLTARALRENGYVVRTAATGAESVGRAGRRTCRSGRAGYHVAGHQRYRIVPPSPPPSDVPIIFVSARGSEEDRVLGLELEQMIIWPSHSAHANWLPALAQFFAAGQRWAAILRGKPAPQWRHTFRWLDSVNGASRTAFAKRGDGGSDRSGIRPSGNLYRQPQRVLGRERLIELSRTRLGDSSDRSVDVLVSRLRRKLSAAGGLRPS
jgi:two-component system OmpR family response regulator